MLRRLIIAGLLVGLLSACSSTATARIEVLSKVSEQVGAPVQEVARLTGEYGEQVIFTFQKGDTCGWGLAYASPQTSGSGHMSHECHLPSPPAFEVLVSGRWLPQGAAAAFPELQYGPVHNPLIVRMEVTLVDGRHLPATVKDGFWYIQLPAGSGKTVITAYDRAGTIVETNTPVVGP